MHVADRLLEQIIPDHEWHRFSASQISSYKSQIAFQAPQCAPDSMSKRSGVSRTTVDL
jgi:hypothetical protein